MIVARESTLEKMCIVSAILTKFFYNNHQTFSIQYNRGYVALPLPLLVVLNSFLEVFFCIQYLFN